MIKIINNSKISKARTGIIATAHGKLETPFYMPDATRAALKGHSQSDIEALGLPAMVVNTFHLYLQPGNKRVKDAGGVHKFMNTSVPLVSDSGGFQVFSLIHRGNNMGTISDKGARFKSPINGAWHELDPKKSINVQMDLGTDMVICLDDCPPNDSSEQAMRTAVDRTIRWARICKDEFDLQIKRRKIVKNKKPHLIAVIQGGESVATRNECAAKLVAMGFDGYGYGARPVDKDGNFLHDVMLATAEAVPNDKFRFALGIGTPEDIVRCSQMGYDIFDCVIPTREGRHGKLFYFQKDTLTTKTGKVAKFYKNINISNAKFIKADVAINEFSKQKELRQYSKAYLHHLFKVKDPLGARLASLQNLEFYTDLMIKIREAINNNKL